MTTSDRSPSAPRGAPAAPRYDPGDTETEDTLVEIGQNRIKMGGTVDTIRPRTDSEALTEQVKDRVHDVADHASVAAHDMIGHAIQGGKDAAIEFTDHAVQWGRDTTRDAATHMKGAAWDATVGRAESAVSTAGETTRGVGAAVIETIERTPLAALLAAGSLAWLYMRWSASPRGYR